MMVWNKKIGSSWQEIKRLFLREIEETRLKIKTTLGYSYPPNTKRIEIELTTQCNLACFNCDRSCAQAPSNNSMTIHQIEHFIADSLNQKWQWNKITLMGGEPTIHPHFDQAVTTLSKYQREYPNCIIEIGSNGYTRKSQLALQSLPPNICVQSSNKNGIINYFLNFNDAPIDSPSFEIKKQKLGCYTTTLCGLGLSRYGYYPCGAGAAIDRVMGFDIGIKKLSEITSMNLKKQMECLCQYCGYNKTPHYWEYRLKRKRTPLPISKSWQEAYRKHENNKPSLTLVYDQ